MCTDKQISPYGRAQSMGKKVSGRDQGDWRCWAESAVLRDGLDSLFHDCFAYSAVYCDIVRAVIRIRTKNNAVIVYNFTGSTINENVIGVGSIAIICGI